MKSHINQTILWAISFLLAACAGGDKVSLHKNVPIESKYDLTPPIVDDPVYECARAVHVSGFAPHAHVKVYANLYELVGQATPHFGFADIDLIRPLIEGDTLSATQTIVNIESDHSRHRVTVKHLPEFPDGHLAAPVIASNIYECGKIVPVKGLIPGAEVSVYEDGNLTGSNNATRSRASVSTLPLTKDRPVVAEQTLCAAVPGMNPLKSPKSETAWVFPVPDPFRQPEPDLSTFVVGNDSITLDDLYVGAKVTVFNHGNVIDESYATDKRNWVRLPGPIEPTWSLRAEQQLCSTAKSTGIIPLTDRLPAPELIGPICDSDECVRVQGSVINATVVLLCNGKAVGFAGAQKGELVFSRSKPFKAGDSLAVFQFAEGVESPLSNPLTVYSCSQAWVEELADEILNSASSDQIPAQCGSSTVPLFMAAPYEALQVTLRADFHLINTGITRSVAKSPGVLKYLDPLSGKTISIDVMVEARGNTRFSLCGWRPLRIRFDSNPKGTVFDGTGKVIKIVTHCGDMPEDQWVLEGTPVEHTRRLLQELALYKVIATLDSSSLATRLALITYEDPSGMPITKQYAFFRERESRAAKRCGFKEIETLPQQYDPDPTSLFQAEFHHKFLFSNDYILPGGHNCVCMKSPSGSIYYIPYDFDFSGIICPQFGKNYNRSIEESGKLLIDWLAAHPDQDLVRVQVIYLLLYEQEMRQLVEDCPVDGPGKDRLRLWLNDHLARLKCFMN